MEFFLGTTFIIIIMIIINLKIKTKNKQITSNNTLSTTPSTNEVINILNSYRKPNIINSEISKKRLGKKAKKKLLKEKHLQMIRDEKDKQKYVELQRRREEDRIRCVNVARKRLEENSKSVDFENKKQNVKSTNIFINNFVKNNNADNRLYYFSFRFRNKKYYKIGITSQTLKKRYGKDYEKIEKILYDEKIDGAMRIEKEIKEKYKDYIFPLAYLNGGGHTETFDKDILQLDV